MAALTICNCVLKIKDQLGAAYSSAELVSEPRKSQVHSIDALYIGNPKRSQASPAVTIQDLLYVSDDPTNTSITVAYTAGGTAGAEVVTVVLNAISVQIQSGVSTATQVRTAVLASVAAAALVDVILSGTGATAQVSSSAVSLTDYVSVLKLAETTTDSVVTVFTLNWQDSMNYNSIIFDPVAIPNQAYLDLSTLLTVSRG